MPKFVSWRHPTIPKANCWDGLVAGEGLQRYQLQKNIGVWSLVPPDFCSYSMFLYYLFSGFFFLSLWGYLHVLCTWLFALVLWSGHFYGPLHRDDHWSYLYTFFHLVIKILPLIQKKKKPSTSKNTTRGKRKEKKKKTRDPIGHLNKQLHWS